MSCADEEKTKNPSASKLGGNESIAAPAPTLLLQARRKQETSQARSLKASHQSLLRNPDFELARSLVPVT
jgi:hypothetical protein